MAAEYQALPVGVLKRATGQRIVPQSGELWDEYLRWLKTGQVPDPYTPPAKQAETLAAAQRRRAEEIRAAGLQRMQARLPAIASFDTVQLLREVLVSVAPQARALTGPMQWLVDVWQAGEAALAQVRAASTVEQVDAVVPNWPKP